MSFISDIFTGAGKATKTATKAATDAAAQNNALARDIYGQTVERIDPYSASGLDAQGYRNALLGLPSSVSRETASGGFQNYLDDFGYQRELDEGSTAIRGNQASRRLLGSGSTLKALQRFGLGTRDRYRTDYMNYLGSQQASGLGAATSLAGVGANYTGQVSANNNSAASAIGNAALTRSATNTNFLSGIIGAAATLSDERAKTIVAKVGELEDGLPIFRYTYIGSDIEHTGVIAQDVARYRPWALGPARPDGMLSVDYEALEAA